ncbi:MAG: helicase-exonuclease AddAB subunit AddA [Clostridiales bacterium]|nr:helicase-exonuclease AddAB subunit AddA [Clostridiales bacterium]
MGERQWTPEQLRCIEARGGTVLVSAAAGSGKTSVLVARLVGLITDPVNPVDVDRLLVVTFTRAAAAEMKRRIAEELARLLAANPSSRRLRRQQMLLPRAAIGTVHSFCSGLLREHFQQLDLSPRFRVGEESETALLRQESLAEVLEELYIEREPAFLELSEVLGGGRDDRRLTAAVRRLYDFIQSHPWPDEWLKEKERLFWQEGPLEQTGWAREVTGQVRRSLLACVSLLGRAAALADGEPKMAAAYGPALRAAQTFLASAARELDIRDWDGQLALAQGLPAGFGRLGALRQYEDEPRKRRVAALWDEAKRQVKRLPELFCGNEAQCREDMAVTGREIAALFEVTRRYAARFAEKKKRRRLVDFNDLEHMALRLLVERDAEGRPSRTPLAIELAERYEQVLVDEYQDTNAAQDALFGALSREESNLFFVGDVKQSIYGFRQAMPELFIRRRERYTEWEGQEAPAFPAAVTLGHNFRSRREVTDAVNFVFGQLMRKEAGGIDYERKEELLPAAVYPPLAGCETELILVDGGTREEGDDRDRAEARVVASRICTLMERFRETRPLAWGDICVLLRSKSAHAPAWVDELNRCGVPAWTAASGGFFDAPEVAAALSLLRSIDNPTQDIPLLSALVSPVAGFEPDELAKLRLFRRDGALYSVLGRYVRQGPEETLRDRCRAVLTLLDRFRTLAATLPADRLIYRLYEETGLTAAARAGRHGGRRLANLRLLHEYARRFEQGGFRGLSSFMRYIDRLEQQGAGLSPAAPVGAADAVQVMSIHNSKGLEFPIVFLAGLGGQFNDESTRSDLLLHPEAGAGLVRREPDTGRQYNTLPRQGVALAIRRSERAEELRVLYVAMTRAREKLYLVMTLRDPAAGLTRLAASLPADGEETALPAALTLSAHSMGEWLLTAALRHPSGALLRRLAEAEDLPLLPAEEPWRMEVVPSPPAEEPEKLGSEPAAADPALVRRLTERIAWRYPQAALTRIPSKLAASELSRRRSVGEHIASRRPAFLSESGLTPAERGTALHTFMQFADYAAAAVAPEQERDRLVAGGFLTEQQGASLPFSRIRAFFGGELYRRMQRSPALRREAPFTVALPAKALAGQAEDSLPPGETVVVQGIADCVFEEEGGLVIVDYKTDQVKTEAELTARYRDQLRVYAFALAQTYALPVRECLLYAFALSRTVLVELDEAPMDRGVRNGEGRGC